MAAKPAGPAEFLEVERKFDVTSDTISPSFDGLSAVVRTERSPSQSLDATYFDTPARDLAAHRITLRRRTGGDDEGWHLKLPAGPDARTELRAPLRPDGDTVPADLLDVVLAIVRDTPLAPVARIRTERRIQVLFGEDGTRLAEFCDDRVTATAFPAPREGDETAEPEPGDQFWREWELELLDGGDRALLERLTNRLLDAGAEVAGSGSKLARALGDVPQRGPAAADPIHRAVAEQVDELLLWDRAVRADVYDSVHQMRVTTRKIRSLLQTSEASFGLTDDAWVLDELRELAAVLGVARDAEVLAEKYATALDALPKDLVRGPVRERLVDGANARYAAGLRRSHSAMRSVRYFRLLDALDELVAAHPTAEDTAGGGEAKSDSVGIAYKKVRKAAKVASEVYESSASEAEADEALHRIRKRAKRLRYTAAATGAKKVAEAAKAVQTLLGDHQDSVVSREHLAQQAIAAHAAGEDTFTYGVLYQREDDIATSSRAQLDEALKTLAKAARKET